MAIEKRLVNIIDKAHEFLSELNSDTKSFNQNIDLLNNSDQQLIKGHLSQFQSLGFSKEKLSFLKVSSEF